MFNTSLLKKFRSVAIIEGVSFLVLLFIAMPLKYIFDQPLAVKYTGWVHGVLFIAYIYFLVQVWIYWKWDLKKVIVALIVSLVPFGTFYFDKKYLRNNAG